METRDETREQTTGTGGNGSPEPADPPAAEAGGPVLDLAAIEGLTDPTREGGHVPTVSQADLDRLPSDAFLPFRKTSLTRMARIAGPFQVQTSEGLLSCQDGFLAVDARGYPYPIATDEQKQIYASASDDAPATDHAARLRGLTDELVKGGLISEEAEGHYRNLADQL